jgi:hypothetical protein
MSGSSDVAKFTAHDGAVWLHLGSERFNIPPDRLEKSQVLVDALLSADGLSIARHFTLCVPPLVGTQNL